jgi:hypothetical protein
LQGKVLIEGSTLDRFPTVIFPLPHCAVPNRRTSWGFPLS